MPRVKNLLKRIEVQTAKGTRTCVFSGRDILKGEQCIRVWDAPRDVSGYSREVALKMIADARERLDQYERDLNSNCPCP